MPIKLERNTVFEVVRQVRSETKTTQITINIHATSEKLDIFKSKLGGLPYLPFNTEVPLDSAGRQLALLAQFDCSKLPENDIYPKKGFMQFWIGRDKKYGLGDKKGYKVVYYPNIDTSITEEDVLKKYKLLGKKDFSPFNEKNCNLDTSFVKVNTFISMDHYEFEKKIMDTINKLIPDANITDFWEDLEQDVAEYFYNRFSTSSNVIGGYPVFWGVSDPRPNKKLLHHNKLLLQLNGLINLVEPIELNWGGQGDGGTHFFIPEEDLEKLNFDNVFYYWSAFEHYID